MKGNSMELNIQRFAEGGAEGSSSGTAAVAQPQETGGAENNTAQNASVAGEQNGVQTGAEEVTLDSFFEKHPELKKENDKRTEKIVKTRVHQINKSMKPQNDLIDELMVQHNVDNFEDLSKKLKASIREEFSMQNGLSEEMGNEVFNTRVQNAQTRRMQALFEAQQEADRQYNVWNDEATKVQETYPDFDLEKELENPEFGKLLKVNVPMQHIYEMLHHTELVEAAKKNTAAAYAKSTQQIASRPAENGLGNQAAVNGQKDVSKLTKKERAELAKRAQRGETITF